MGGRKVGRKEGTEGSRERRKEGRVGERRRHTSAAGEAGREGASERGRDVEREGEMETKKVSEGDKE